MGAAVLAGENAALGEGHGQALAVPRSEDEYIAAGVRALRDTPCYVQHASVECTLEDVRLPIHAAACAWSVEILTLLLEAGADVNALSGAGFSALELALRVAGPQFPNRSDKEDASVARVVQLLLRAGASPKRSKSRYDGYGRALDYAAIYNASWTFDALLAAGADPAPVPFIGWAVSADGSSSATCSVTYIGVATELGYTAIIDSALRAGVSPETRYNEGPSRNYTLLQIAVYRQQREVFELLLRRGANPNATFARETSCPCCGEALRSTTLCLAKSMHAIAPDAASKSIAAFFVRALEIAVGVLGQADTLPHSEHHDGK